MPTADHALLHRWTRHGDADAFAELVRRHAGAVHAVCRRIVDDRTLAEDLTQECFLSLAKGGASMPERSLAGWLHRVATNRALSARRARRPVVEAVEVADAATPDRLAAWREVEAHVDAAIAELPDDQRAAVVGHFLEGRSHRDLARELGVGHRTVGYRIERGVESVREALRRAGVDVERSALAVWLGALPRETAPPAVLASLGKAAVAGHGAATATAVVATVGAAKSTAIGIAALALLAITATFVALREGTSPGIRPAAGEPAPRTAAAPPQVDPAAGPGPGRVEVADAGDNRGAVTAAPAALLTGFVRTPDGEPVPAADVVLVELPEDGARRFLAPIELREVAVHRATSDAQGRFVVERRDSDGAAWVSAFREGMVGRRQEIGVRGGPGSRVAGEVVLELAPGRTLRGRVVGPDGAVLEGALVTVAQSWSEADWGRVSGIAITDARGAFAVGVDENAIGCTLRVNAERHGQDLFRNVPTDAFAELRWQPRATLRGRVDGMTPARAGTVVVIARGELPDPPVPVMYTGMRPPLDFEATVDADGTYAVDDLQPGLTYEAILVGVKEEQEETHPSVLPGPRLSPATGDRFTPAHGEVVTRDFALAAPIVVTGRVRTATSHRPIGEALVQVTKDGQPLWDGSRHADKDGAFRLRLVAGDGVYTFRASPPRWGLDGPATATIERRLLAGESVELDLEVPEPVVVPFRVVDADGRPIESVRTELSVTTADGKRSSIGDSQRLDAEGRSRFELFAAVAKVRIVVNRFPHGPGAAVALDDLPPGLPVPEQTLTLPDACDVFGSVQNADGTPAAQNLITVVARYGDGATDRYSTSTDRDGKFTAAGAFRAESATFTVRHSSGARGTVEGAPAADGRVDLGVVVVAR